MTDRLYYGDSHMREFDASVLQCEKSGDRWSVILDRTAFFPEGGGQAADTGFIDDAPVLDVQETDGEIIHYTAAPLSAGTEYKCSLDWGKRFSRMQNHSGEHIVSGIVHMLYGYDNVGFHMGADEVTIDFNGELGGEDITKIERLANVAVTQNLAVTAVIPPADELADMNYRSKKAFSGDVRIVTVESVDVCACCAPHVSRTGEIGVIKLLSCARHRGGSRIAMVCGGMAYEDYRLKHESVAEISADLSAKQSEVAQAVRRIKEENERLKYRCTELYGELVRLKLAAIEETDGNICIFDGLLPEPALRELVNGAVKKCSGLAAVFSREGDGYRYIIGSRSIDLRAAARSINEGIGGRGGGSPKMIQGRASKPEPEIRKFLCSFKI